jgi:ATP-dependent RNA helicase DDX24/MAK5
MLSSNYGVDIIVATPGRLWDMLEEDEELGKAIKGIQFLVLDEADRMIENGHFAELENIIALTKRSSDKKAKKQTAKKAEEDEVFVNDFEAGEDTLEAWPVRQNIKTYVFSATMSKELQRNVQKKGKKRLVAEEDKGKLGALGDLIEKLDFRDEDPLVIDLTVEGGLVKQLQEVKVDCLLNEKDFYLYYFILRYPGRTLVFLSSIDAIRRLKPLMELLQINAAILHSGMQQRARLKALDR